jgi:hypothetical protein
MIYFLFKLISIILYVYNMKKIGRISTFYDSKHKYKKIKDIRDLGELEIITIHPSFIRSDILEDPQLRTLTHLQLEAIKRLIKRIKIPNASEAERTKVIKEFNATVLPSYTTWKKKTTTQSSVDLVTKAILDWSPTFVKNPNTGSRVDNHRISIACRFLFYAYPDFPVFNFSDALSDSLNLQKRPQAAIPYFNEILALGMITNRLLLAKTVMPQPTSMSLVLWKRAEKNGWWKRRVLDLALLLHFRCMTARVELQREARRLTRPKPKAKLPKPSLIV